MRWWPRKKVYLDDLPKTHDLRFAVLFLLGLTAVFAGLYGVGYAVAGDTVPRGSSVSEVEIGNLKRGEAETVLRSELVPRLQRPITLQSERGDFPIDPQVAGMTLDVEATVDAAMAGDDWDPRHMLAVVFGGDEIDPVVDFDDQEFMEALAPIAAKVRVAPVNSRVVFVSGQPRVRYGSVGEAVDLAELQSRLVEAVRDDERTVRLPLRDVPADITPGEAERFLRSEARPAVAEPVRLRSDVGAVTVPPDQFAAALSVTATTGGLRLEIDPALAYRLSAPSRAALQGQPVNARVVLRDGRPTVLPGRPGRAATPAAWAESVLAAAQREPGSRTARLVLTPRPPGFGTADAEALRIRTRIAQYTVRFPDTVGYAAVRQAARDLDGVVLRPGGSLSFLGRVRLSGDPLAATSVATATYNTALLAGLEVVDRSSIRRDAEFLPRGREALALRPRDDLGLENRLPYGVLLHAETERTRQGGLVRVEAYGSRWWGVTLRTSAPKDRTFPEPIRRDGPRCERRPGTPGYTIEVTRIREREGQRRVDVFSSRYAPERGVVCGSRR